MKIRFHLLALLLILQSCNLFSPVDPLPPAVTTDAPTGVVPTGFVAHGTITAPSFKNTRQKKKSGDIVEYGFILTNGSSRDTVKKGSSLSSSPLNFEHNYGGLGSNQKYSVQAYAKNEGGGSAEGTPVEVTTGSYTLPTLTTGVPTGVSTNTATVSFNISGLGNAPASESGVCYSALVSSPTTGQPRVTISKSPATGNSSANLVGLDPNTKYYARGYVITGAGVAYGNTVEFTTFSSVPAHITAIDAKFKALGWNTDGHAPFNGTGPVKTASGKGYVQYYAFGGGKTAIYYSPEKGAYGMNTTEMNAYEAAGQDKFALVVSDPKSCGTGCNYNDILSVAGDEGVIWMDKLVYGEIYKKYKALNRWNGILGIPVTTELNLTSGKGRYNAFKGGQIYWAASTGAQAFWGKVHQLYAATGYDMGWLGLPKESCDPAKKDANQNVGFQNGRIGVASNGTCGNYYSNSGLLVYKDGSFSKVTPPCY